MKQDPIIEDALRYTRDTMGVSEDAGKSIRQTHKRILKITCEDYISAEPFLQNLFYIIDHSGLNPRQAWDQVCIGSDLDGLIDPIDLCPTASHYPRFRDRLRQFIPIFLQIRAAQDPARQARTYAGYFSEDFTIDMALDKLFYESLRDFTAQYFVHPASGSLKPTP